MKWLLLGMLLCALVVVAPVVAQDYQGDPVETRSAGMVLQVFDPDADGGEGRFFTISFSDLLSGAVRFPDTFRRYVNVIEWVAGTPTLTTPSFSGATRGASGDLSVQLPAPPPGATLVRLIFAIPVAAGDPTFANVGGVNSGLNFIAGYAKQTAEVMLDGTAHNAWYSINATFPASFTNYLFLDAAAAP